MNKRYKKHLHSINVDGTKVITNVRFTSVDRLYVGNSFELISGNPGTMSINRSCTLYLGVYIAEHVLSEVFKDVVRMPNGNIGYDFICGKGYKIDVKSVCVHKSDGRRGWTFHPRCNNIADYFLCLAFDNRDDLNPLHLWLVPGYIMCDKTSTYIGQNTLKKWECFKIDKMSNVVKCCNLLRGD